MKQYTVRKISKHDAEGMVGLMKQVDSQTRFLAREPNEFNTNMLQEKRIIKGVMNRKSEEWFVAIYDGKLIGQASVGIKSGKLRYRHRAGIALCILKEFWGIGIGSALMEKCIEWAKNNKVEQIELEVVSTNERGRALYKKYGFEETGTIPRALKYQDGTYADEITMIKYL